ncbi:M4 family metallopeptidase [Streptosporangium saharense]|uniref:Zn-dependent metalloprotease n=1 Tax=Streptosporangium saharense TaxID=1706840 RepID=A0A7W7VM56_9ACTN|nr:M4 family metallopeptidase [Streptosporangium saharense]MBB4915357.1 Zn-dependent metalloprotease [Streptosporangium saharense]
MNPKVKLGAVAMLAAAAMTTTSIVSATSATAAPANTGVRTITTDAVGFSKPTPEGQKRAIALAGKAIAAQEKTIAKSEDDSFALEKATSVGDVQFLTYDRTYKGLPVYGGEVIVSTDAAGLKVASLETAQKTELNVDTKARVSASKAANTARAQLAKVESVSTPKLVVHALAETGAPRLAWEVVVTGSSKTAPSVLHTYVDAVTGSIISKWDAVRMGTGNGFYNGQVTITTTSGYTMRDNTRSGLACGGQNGSAYTKSTDSWGNGQGTNLETACVDAYWAAQKEWDMLKDWFGYNGFNGRGTGYPARVGLNQVNAFWNGSYTNFGHNQANTQQATPMDVVGHEYGHAIYQFAGAGGGGSSNEDGGLNESTGDIFGALLESYANNPNDPPDYTVGEEVNLVGSGPIRYMYKPSTNGDPDCYSSRIPSTEVHAAAGPQNHWFYLVAEGTNPGGGKPASPVCAGPSSLTGIGIQKAGKIYLASLQLRGAGNRTHAQARSQTLTAAKQLYPNSCTEFNAVKAAWTAVSVPAVSNEPTCTIQNQDDFSIAVNPSSASVQAGASTSATVNTAVTAGSAQNVALSATGAPSGTTVSFSPSSVTAGQSSTVNIATSASTPSGNYTITINGAGSVTRSTTFSLSVTGQPGQNDFSVSVNPSSATVSAGGSTSATLATAVTSGSAQNVALSASGAPSGTTVSFSPSSVTAGQSSTVNIATSASTPAGTYTITLTGTGASATHGTSFTLTVGGGQGGTTWQEWKQYTAGDVVTYNGVSYRCLQSHTSLPGWDPPNVPALWQRI